MRKSLNRIVLLTFAFLATWPLARADEPPASEAQKGGTELKAEAAPAANTTTETKPAEKPPSEKDKVEKMAEPAAPNAVANTGKTPEKSADKTVRLDGLTLVVARWAITLYGMVEADHIYDTTQSFSDVAGNGQVARPGTYAGDHGRLTFGLRDSRIGLRVNAPEWHRIKAGALMEMDFAGNQAVGTSEAAFFVNPGFRIRHAYLNLETPAVDLLIGQTWQLFGGGGAYQPSTVLIFGVPGNIFSRAPQIRLSRKFVTPALTIELALAAARPPQRDSYTPDGQALFVIAANRWTGMQSIGSVGKKISPFSIAFSGDVRRFSVAEFSAAPTKSVDALGWGAAVDVFLPLIPATPEKKGNSLSLNAEYAYGRGTADLYLGLTGGVSFPPLPNPGNVTPAPVYTPNIDPGLAVFTADGALHPVQWQSAVVGAQYFFPRLDGRLWIAANYAHLQSDNATQLGDPKKTRARLDFVDGNLFGDLTPAVRLGLGYAWYRDRYGDGVVAINHRVQFSAFYLF